MEFDHHSSIKDKLKSQNCFSSCFGHLYHHHHHQSQDSPVHLVKSSSEPTSPSGWIKSTAKEIPEKCMSLVSKMKKSRRCNSADFKYDPLSYALNFDEDNDDDDDEFPFRDFSARLPTSPRNFSGREVSALN